MIKAYAIFVTILLLAVAFFAEHEAEATVPGYSVKEVSDFAVEAYKLGYKAGREADDIGLVRLTEQDLEAHLD